MDLKIMYRKEIESYPTLLNKMKFNAISSGLII
mgnify:CR=1 FL=1